MSSDWWGFEPRWLVTTASGQVWVHGEKEDGNQVYVSGLALLQSGTGIEDLRQHVKADGLVVEADGSRDGVVIKRPSRNEQ